MNMEQNKLTPIEHPCDAPLKDSSSIEQIKRKPGKVDPIDNKFHQGNRR